MQPTGLPASPTRPPTLAPPAPARRPCRSRRQLPPLGACHTSGRIPGRTLTTNSWNRARGTGPEPAGRRSRPPASPCSPPPPPLSGRGRRPTAASLGPAPPLPAVQAVARLAVQLRATFSRGRRGRGLPGLRLRRPLPLHGVRRRTSPAAIWSALHGPPAALQGSARLTPTPAEVQAGFWRRRWKLPAQSPLPCMSSELPRQPRARLWTSVNKSGRLEATPLMARWRSGRV